MKDLVFKHLKQEGFEITEEKDGSDTLLNIIDAESGDISVTFVFSENDALKDIWNPWKERLADYKEEVKELTEDAELGKAIKTISKLFTK